MSKEMEAFLDLPRSNKYSWIHQVVSISTVIISIVFFLIKVMFERLENKDCVMSKIIDCLKNLSEKILNINTNYTRTIESTF